MKITKLFALIMTFFVYVNIFNTSKISYAHDDNCNLQHDSKYTGWDIFEDSYGHLNHGQSITLSYGDFNNTSDSTFVSAIDYAKNQWNSAYFNGSKLINVSIDNVNGSVTYLKKEPSYFFMVSNDDKTWAVAERGIANKDGNNHVLTTNNNMQISVNWRVVCGDGTTTYPGKSQNAKNHIATHELGHFVGLKDIPASVSSNAYLMCNEFGSLPAQASLTSQDIQGAAVILGVHTNNNHVFNPPVSHDSTYNRESCKYCGAYRLIAKPPAHTCSASTYRIVSSATCTTSEIRQGVCSCGKDYGSTYSYGSSLGHAYGIYKYTIAPTCTAQGYDVYACVRCTSTTYKNYTAIKPHSWSSWTTTKSATCTTTGTQTRKCNYCGKTETQTTSALGHSLKTIVDSYANCISPLKYKTYCIRCTYASYSYSGTPNFSNHSWTAWTFDGYKTVTRKCTRCGRTESKSVY